MDKSVVSEELTNPLKWHMPTMLRWLAENIDAPRLPDGTLTGRFLYATAEKFEALAMTAASPAQEGVDKVRDGLEYIVRQDGKGADGLIDWQRCVDRIQGVARDLLSALKASEHRG